MNWIMDAPREGDMIRVKAGSFYHYGIYISDSEVIQFGDNPTSKAWTSGENIAVISGSIDDFLLGGFLEVARFDKKELKLKKSPRDTVSIARSRIGETGYHILHNNCEHFVNECVFGTHSCEQVDSVRAFFKSLVSSDKSESNDSQRKKT